MTHAKLIRLLIQSEIYASSYADDLLCHRIAARCRPPYPLAQVVAASKTIGHPLDPAKIERLSQLFRTF